MLGRLVEPSHFAPNLYASDLAPCQIFFHGNRKWRLHHSGFGLITLLSCILLIRLLAILDSIDGGHVSNHQSNATYIYIYIYIYIYACKG